MRSQICRLSWTCRDIDISSFWPRSRRRPAPAVPAPMTISADWQLQDVAKVPQAGAEVSSAAFKPTGWYAATVPGTVLTTLVNNHVYPEPLYGENNRPENIPESLAHTSYWYRTTVDVPRAYKGQRVWLNFDGINYSVDGLGQRRAGGHDARRLHPRHIRHHVQRDAGQEGGACRAGGAAAPPRRLPRAHAAQRHRAQRRRSPPSTAPRFFAPSAGTGFPPSATATPASGRRCFSPPPAQWW